MEKITIYKFQLETIAEVLRIAANVYDSRANKVTSFDRQLVQAEQYANNALNGNIDIRVP